MKKIYNEKIIFSNLIYDEIKNFKWKKLDDIFLIFPTISKKY